MHSKFVFLFFIGFVFSGFSQETDKSTMLNTTSTEVYNLDSFASAIFLCPESLELDTPTIKISEIGHTLKYYLGNSDVYILGGLQTIISTNIDFERSYNFGYNAGMGYDVSDNIQIEGRTFQSLYNTVDNDEFQPVQLIPLQPLNLGFKAKF